MTRRSPAKPAFVKRLLRYWAHGAASILLCAAWWGYAEYRSVERIQWFTKRFAAPSGDATGMRGSTADDAKRLSTLWQVWEKRDPSGAILRALRDPNEDVRRYALRMAAKLELSAAEQFLQQMPTGQLPPLIVQLARARIRSRHQQGRARLETIASAVGLTWHDVGKIAHRYNGRLSPFDSQGRAAVQLIDELIDVAYSMGRRGQNVENCFGDIQLTDVQKIRLRGASVSPKQEAQWWIDYALQQQALTTEKEKVSDYLYELGPDAVEPVMRCLKQIKANPRAYVNKRGYKLVFEAAYKLGDEHALPLFHSLSRYPDKWLAGDAYYYALHMQMRLRKGKFKTVQMPVSPPVEL